MRRHRVFLLVTAAALALAAAAPAWAADIPANRNTRAVITPGPGRFQGTFERGRDSDWYRVTLRGGRNYAFQAFSFCDSRVNLRDAAGRVVRSSNLASDNGDAGFEFRPATTRTYFVEYVDIDPAVCLEFGGSYPIFYSGNVATEIRGDTTTRATIAPGQSVSSLINWGADRDYVRATLDAGRTHTLSMARDHPQSATLTVVDPRGRVVAGGDRIPFEPLQFRVPKTGTYYVVVAGDGEDFGPYPYSVSLTAP